MTIIEFYIISYITILTTTTQYLIIIRILTGLITTRTISLNNIASFTIPITYYTILIFIIISRTTVLASLKLRIKV